MHTILSLILMFADVLIAGEIQSHLQAMLNLLRPEDTIKIVRSISFFLASFLTKLYAVDRFSSREEFIIHNKGTKTELS